MKEAGRLMLPGCTQQSHSQCQVGISDQITPPSSVDQALSLLLLQVVLIPKSQSHRLILP